MSPATWTPCRRSARSSIARSPASPRITDELLRNPPAEDWLTWRRTRDNHGYTPLDQIGPDNVAGLRLAWALASGNGLLLPERESAP